MNRTMIYADWIQLLKFGNTTRDSKIPNQNELVYFFLECNQRLIRAKEHVSNKQGTSPFSPFIFRK